MGHVAIGRATADPALAQRTLKQIKRELASLLAQEKKYEELAGMHTADATSTSKID